jgi:GATA-binding protein, other eukaryote
MSAAAHVERGGSTAIRAAALPPGFDDSTPIDDVDLLNYSAPDTTAQTITLRQRTLEAFPNACDKSRITGTSTRIGRGKLDLSTQETIARNGLLRESVFPDWEDDAARTGIESPDEMQKKDPLATQIWKLYSKTKTRLPNQERMENLTWRMMAMSLKRREQMQAMFVAYLSLCLDALSDSRCTGRNTASPLPAALRSSCRTRQMIPMYPRPIP